MIISSQFFIETHVYLNHFSRDKFKNLDVDNKMSLSCGWEEPYGLPKNAFFIGVISIYFVTFFFEHTVLHSISYYFYFLYFLCFLIGYNLLKREATVQCCVYLLHNRVAERVHENETVCTTLWINYFINYLKWFVYIIHNRHDQINQIKVRLDKIKSRFLRCHPIH